jgi:pentatricopeptide repeat protein
MLNGYVKLGRLSDAEELFDGMPVRDVASWNTLMSGYFQSRQQVAALETFVSMHRSGNSLPNAFTFGCAMKSCGTLGWRGLALQLLGMVQKFESPYDSEVAASLVDMFLRCGDVDLASRLFVRIPNPTIFCRNSMIVGYAKAYGIDVALEFFIACLNKTLFLGT